MSVTVDKYTRVLLTVIAVLLFVISAALWLEAPQVVSDAQARIPDSGQQLDQILQKTEQMSVSMAELKNLLTSGQVKVQIVQPKKSSTQASQLSPSTVK